MRAIGSALEARELQLVGMPIKRIEDLRLLTGQGKFIDDLPTPPNVHFASVVRSPYAHARIKNIDVSRALAMPGVRAVITGKEIKDVTDPFPMAIPTPVKYYSVAVDKVRYVGEPVAVVVARDRFSAEDAADLVEV